MFINILVWIFYIPYVTGELFKINSSSRSSEGTGIQEQNFVKFGNSMEVKFKEAKREVNFPS